MLTLSRSERIALERRAQADLGRSPSARHARLVLLLADGHTWAEIRQRLGCSDSFIARWSKRFATERLAGLYVRHAGRERYKLTDKLERRVLDQTIRHTPADGSRYWSSRKLAAELGGAISHMTVARIWAKHGIKPHRLESSTLPDPLTFNASAADIVGLYLNRPQHAAVFCLADRLPSIGASSEPEASTIGTRPGLLALRRSLLGRGEGGSVPRTRRSVAAELVAFLASVLAQHPLGREMHVVADNAPATRPRHLAQLLEAHPDLHLHVTSTYAAWITQIDRILGNIEHALIASGTSRHALGTKTRIMRAIRHLNQRPSPLKWSYVPGPPETGGPPLRASA